MTQSGTNRVDEEAALLVAALSTAWEAATVPPPTYGQDGPGPQEPDAERGPEETAPDLASLLKAVGGQTRRLWSAVGAGVMAWAAAGEEDERQGPSGP